MTVEVNLRVVNPKDAFQRVLGLWVDSPPPDGWQTDLALQETAALTAFIQDGDTVRGSFDLSDGKHDIYVAISQTDSRKLGFWTIEGNFNGVKAPTVSRVDHNTVGKYEVTVSGGVVVSSAENMDELRDVTGLSALDATKKALSDVKSTLASKTSEIRVLVAANKKESAILGAASVGIAAFAVVFNTRRSHRF